MVENDDRRRERIRKLVREIIGRRSEPWQKGPVLCQGSGCRERLDYEYGSIAWNSHDRDLCPKCAATEAVDAIFARLRLPPQGGST